MERTQAATRATILIIDNTSADVQFLSDALARHSYRVKSVGDGEAAVLLAQSAQPDLVLLNVAISEDGFDGYHICRQLKENAQTRDIPLIFMITADDVGYENDCSKDSVDYVTKPLRAEELLARINIHLALNRRNYQLALLNQVSRELSATLDLRRIAVEIQHAVTEIVEAAGSSVWLIDREDETWLVCHAAFQHDAEQYWADLRVRVGQGVVGWAVQSGESAIIADAAHDNRFFSGIDEQTGYQTNTLLAVPLKVRERVIGVLEVVDKQSGGRFDDNDLDLVETIAASAAIAIDNTWLVEALHQHAIDLENSNAELQAAIAQVKILSGLLPICSGCKKIRDDHGYWQQVEIYISKHTEAEFSHGLCPDCLETMYPDLYRKLIERRNEILAILDRLGKANLEAIAETVGLPQSNTLNRLNDMLAEGFIKCIHSEGQDLYQLADGVELPLSVDH